MNFIKVCKSLNPLPPRIEITRFKRVEWFVGGR